MNKLKTILLGLVVILLTGVIYYQCQIVKNQKAQMWQQFHSDFITLTSLYNDDLLNKLGTDFNFPEHGEQGHSCKEHMVINLALQRLITGYVIKNSMTDEEWDGYVESAREEFSKKAFRIRWQKTKKAYSSDVQNFVENALMKE